MQNAASKSLLKGAKRVLNIVNNEGSITTVCKVRIKVESIFHALDKILQAFFHPLNGDLRALANFGHALQANMQEFLETSKLKKSYEFFFGEKKE